MFKVTLRGSIDPLYISNDEAVDLKLMLKDENLKKNDTFGNFSRSQFVLSDVRRVDEVFDNRPVNGKENFNTVSYESRKKNLKKLRAFRKLCYPMAMVGSKLDKEEQKYYDEFKEFRDNPEYKSTDPRAKLGINKKQFAEWKGEFFDVNFGDDLPLMARSCSEWLPWFNGDLNPADYNRSRFYPEPISQLIAAEMPTMFDEARVIFNGTVD